jgi:uncharacterized membrane protein
MTYLVAGLLLFFGVHSLAIVAPAWRDSMATKLGDASWKAIYSLVSAIGFVMLVHGYGLARAAPTVLYVSPAWMGHVAALLMLPVFPLLLATYLPGRIKATVKHPMLTATKAWALAHLLVNGNLADVLLFGGFLAWAVFDRIAVGKRVTPRKPVVTGAPSRLNDVLAIVGGLVLYVVVVAWAHQRFIGVPPILPTPSFPA